MNNSTNVSGLPNGWRLERLEDGCDAIIGGGTPSRKIPEYFTGDIVWLTPTEIPSDEIREILDSKEMITEEALSKSSARIIPAGSVLLTSRASIGKVAIAGKEVATNQGFASFVCSNQIHNRYLAYWLWSNKFLLVSKASGTTFKEISKKKLKQLEIPLPPMDQQMTISNLLESTNNRVKATKQELSRITDLTRKLRMAILSKAFLGGLRSEGIGSSHFEAISTEPLQRSHAKIIKKRKESGKKVLGNLVPVREADLPSIPANWIWAIFEEVVFVIDYRGRTPPYSSEGIPHLRSANIRNGEVVWDAIRYVTKETYDKYMVRGLPEPTDLLFTTEAPLGEVAFVPDKIFSLAQRVVVLKPAKELIDSRFLYYQIMSNQFRSRLFRRSTGTTVKGIAYRNLRMMELVLPSLEEQKMIVRAIEPQLRLLEAIPPFVDDAITKLEHLERSVLKNAFRGDFAQHEASVST